MALRIFYNSGFHVRMGNDQARLLTRRHMGKIQCGSHILQAMTHPSFSSDLLDDQETELCMLIYPLQHLEYVD